MNRKSSYRISILAAATALALSAPAFAQGRINLGGLESAPAHDRFIVKYRDNSQASSSTAKLKEALDSAARALPANRGARATLKALRRLAVGAELIQVSRKLDAAEAESLIRQLAANPEVEYVEVDALHRMGATPNDPMYNGTSKQWHYFESTGGLNLPLAWDKSTGQGVVVGVVDSGHVSHEDLNGNVIGGYDMVSQAGSGQGQSGDGDGRDSDYTDISNVQHGTHVAGTIGAVTNNNKGVAGVAYGAKLIQVRVLGNQGYGSLSDISDGLIWAAGGTVQGVPANQNPAEVVNLSLGGSGSCSSTYQSAINTAVQRGAVVVVAAGNNNGNVSGFQPANCNNVIAVAANDREGNRASYSNYGTMIDITAPGGETATQGNGVLSTLANNGYGFYQGTSMATPHVAGLAALMQAAASSPLTPAQVEQTLKDTARALPGSCSGGCGAGIADAKAAVDAVGGGGGGVPTAAFDAATSGLTVNFTDKSTDAGGSIASRAWEFGDGTTSTATNPTKTYTTAGTYTVKLTVTDNDGNTDDESRQINVTDGGGDNKLTNGTPVTGLSGATGANLRYTMDVPAGASNLKFVTSGGTGDPDLYAKFNAAPTTTSSDCKSETPTTAETCSIGSAQPGTYHVLVYGYAQFSGVSLTGSYSTDGGRQTYTNTADYQIRDNATVESPISVTGRTGSAPNNTAVAVNIVHTFRGDLKVDLVAPDGSTYLLKNYNASDSADNVNTTYTVNISTEALNGTWKLRVNDNAVNDIGYINSWSITF